MLSCHSPQETTVHWFGLCVPVNNRQMISGNAVDFDEVTLIGINSIIFGTIDAVFFEDQINFNEWSVSAVVRHSSDVLVVGHQMLHRFFLLQSQALD